MIQVEKLSHLFETNAPLFQDLSFQVDTNESVVFVGPSGSGKSVLLKLLTGLLSIQKGNVKISSNNLGMLFQKNALFDSLTVEENLFFPLEERLKVKGATAEKRVSHLLEEVGLSHVRKLFPDEISGGMQKRLGIARALIVEPEVIFYDEPTAGLDPITSSKIAELIISLKKERNSTLVVVTNDMQRAYQLGDRIFVLAQGKLHGGLSPEETKATRDPLIRQFIFGIKEGPLS